MPRKYNFIYSRLVEGKGDIIGYIAYALYKDAKIEYINRFKEEHNGKEPDEDDLKQFHDITNTETNIESYKYIASGILQAFLDNTLEETKVQVEDNLNKNHIELIRKAIEPIKPPSMWKSYLNGIAQSVLGAFIFMGLMCILVFVLTFSKNKYSFTIGGEGSAKMEQKVDSVKIDTLQKEIKPLSDR